MTWVFYFSKEGKKKPKHLEPTYLSNYLNKTKKTKKSKKVGKVYMQITLFLKFTFDILLSHKCNLQKNWIKICVFTKLYMQNVVLSLLQDCVQNMNK